MFDKNGDNEKYMRDTFTFAEDLYEKYMDMRKTMNKVENFKYDTKDEMQDSKAFKEGFLAGVKIMSTFFMDM